MRFLAPSLSVVAMLSSIGFGTIITDQFNGFNYIDEIGVSGLQSSYSSDVAGGNKLPNYMPSFGPYRVNYSGVGTSPSGGHPFDEGVLGWMLEDDQLIIRVACGMNPLTGYMSNGRVYSQGDAFLTIEDQAGVVSQFALLNSWARQNGVPRQLDTSSFTGYNGAMNFHTGGMEGHLVLLDSNSDVVLTQGSQAYGPRPGSTYGVPTGLDTRVFAQGGVDLGFMNLNHLFYDVPNSGSDWYVQTWTVPLSKLSSDGDFNFSLHIAPTCGNDQIGMKGHVEGSVPEPATVLLSIAGMGLIGLRRQRPMA